MEKNECKKGGSIMKVLWIVNMLLTDAAEHLGVQTGSSGMWMIDI